MRILLIALGLVLLGLGLWWAFFGRAPDESVATLKVNRGTIVRKAVAVGRVEVENEIPIKSRVGGILTRLFVKLGQRVSAGEALAEVRPVTTDLTLVQAERSLRAAQDAEENAREFAEGKHLAGIIMRMFTGKKSVERMHRGAKTMLQQAEEQLAMIREGRVQVEDRSLDYVVRAPVAGHVLQLSHREGAPIVPSSSYGSGTVLMILADMDRLVFRGTVDEIDVGKLRVGMPVILRVGALAGAEVTGTLREIGLRASFRNNATVFGVRVDVQPTAELTLRSGYSVVAEIEVDRREGVLVLPERVVSFRGGEATVYVPTGSGAVRKTIRTGLSDGLQLEVTEGLQEGDVVLERRPERAR